MGQYIASHFILFRKTMKTVWLGEGAMKGMIVMLVLVDGLWVPEGHALLSTIISQVIVGNSTIDYRDFPDHIFH